MNRVEWTGLRGRVAYYFGTFDPVHLGHLTLARAALVAFGLKAVVFVPTGQPPHRTDRPPLATIQQRLSLLKLATAPDPTTLSVSDAECDEPGPHYTVATLSRLLGERAWEQIDSPTVPLIIGEDTLPTLPSWWQAQALLDKACFLVAARGLVSRSWRQVQTPKPIDLAFTSTLQARGWWIPAPPWAVSATWIRELIAQGGDASPWLDADVGARIQRDGLYRV